MNANSVLESQNQKKSIKEDVSVCAEGLNAEENRGWAWFIEQLIQSHPFKKNLMPRLSVVYDICLANHDLRGAVDRVMRHFQNGQSQRKICWPWWSCRHEIRCLRQFLDYVYFGSDEFLGTVTRP